MKINSGRFWLVVIGLVAFDVVMLQAWLFRPITRIDPRSWDFRIAELRQLENRSVMPITDATPATTWSHHWLSPYFPGLGMPIADRHYFGLPVEVRDSDQHGQIL